MSEPRKLPNGKYQATVQDKRAGIPRTKRTFQTKAQARQWQKAVHEEGHARLLGAPATHLFGHALTEYGQTEDIRSQELNAIRTPVKLQGTWQLLEMTTLEDAPKVAAAWKRQMQTIQKRSYLNKQTYHLIAGTWYLQPCPTQGTTPQPRSIVTQGHTIQKLNKMKGRGPFSTQTLRIRQILIRKVLDFAKNELHWTDRNLAADIQLLPGSKKRKEFLTLEQSRLLINKAPPWLGRAIAAACLIGWRKANLISIKPSQIAWPTVNPDGTIQPNGYIKELGKNVKWHDETEDLICPIDSQIYNLLKESLHNNNSGYVFTDDKGQPLINRDFRGSWKKAKENAGIPANFRWHSLRHTWATQLLHDGTRKELLQALGGWKDPNMVDRYAHWTESLVMEQAQQVTRSALK